MANPSSKITIGPISVRGDSPVVRKAAADPRNTFSGGSCEDFVKHVKETGVSDSEGKARSGIAGRAEFFPAVGAYQFGVTTEYKNMWCCPSAPGDFYEKQSECEGRGKPCASGLGGSMVKCGGEMAYCAKAEVKFPVSGEFLISVLVWKPEKPSPGCLAAKKAFDEAVMAHEKQHIADAKAILEAAKNLPPIPVIGGAKDEADAKEKLREEVRKKAQELIDKMLADYEKKVAEFHATPAGAPTVMDCSACP